MTKHSTTKVDLRIVKTRRALALALLTLLETKAFSEINVNEICSMALVSRSAFYSHFADKYVLLDESMKYVTEFLLKGSTGMSARDRLLVALHNAHKNQHIINNMLMTTFDPRVHSTMQKAFTQLLKDRVVEEKLLWRNPVIPEDLQLQFCAVGLTYSILGWLSNENCCNVDEMADYLEGLLLCHFDGDCTAKLSS